MKVVPFVYRSQLYFRLYFRINCRILHVKRAAIAPLILQGVREGKLTKQIAYRFAVLSRVTQEMFLKRHLRWVPADLRRLQHLFSREFLLRSTGVRRLLFHLCFIYTNFLRGALSVNHGEVLDEMRDEVIINNPIHEHRVENERAIREGVRRQDVTRVEVFQEQIKIL